MRRAAGILPAGLLMLAAATAGRAQPGVLRAVDLGGLEARSAALILSGEEGGELEVSVLPVPLSGDEERVRVGLVIDVEDGGDAAPDDAPLVTEVYAYALDERQEIGGYLAQAFRLDPAERRGVKFFGHLELAPGDYSLRVLVLRRQRRHLGLRVLPLRVPPAAELVVPELVAEPPEAWVLVREAPPPGAGEPDFPPVVDGRIVVPSTRPASAAPEAEIAGDAAAAESLPRRRGKLEARYAEALRRLAAGDGAARSALLAVESVALGRGSDTEVTARFLAFAALLADVDPGSLLPLIHMHEALYREHYRQGRLGLASHSRRMVIGLAELYAARSRSPAARRAIADALVSLAGFLQELWSAPAAEAVFELALGYDAGHQGALLGLAAIREAYGDPQRAAELLKRLLADSPGNSEARLRRAVCLRRLGAARDAEALLGACLGDDNPPWIRAVAYQELAGLYVAAGRYDDAVALLGEALGRLEGSQRLHLQLAAVYDRLERPAEARAALAELDPRAGRETDSPRLVYSRWPTWTIAAARRELAAAAAEHRPDLARALDAAGVAVEP